MDILKRENWWVWLLLTIFSSGSSTLVLGALLSVYDKNAWYAKWYYWVIGLLLLVAPFSIMMMIFNIEILCQTCAKLEVPGKEYYLSPYLWILAIIIPFIGWLAIAGTLLYLIVAQLVALHQGKGEQYIK